MRRTAALILIALVILSVGLVTAQSDSSPMPYVYRIKIDGCDFNPPVRRQTGFRVQGVKGIVTALHGVADCQTISAVTDDGQEIFNDLTLQAVDIDRDTALLSSPALDSLPDVGFAPSALAYAEIPRQDLRVVGYPLGLDKQDIDRGLLIRDIETLDDVIPDVEEPAEFLKRRSPDITITVLNVQAQLLPGHSGAPLLDSSGQAVGVANGGLRGGTVGRSWAIPWRDIDLQPVEQPAVAERLQKLAAKDPALALAFSSTFPAPTTTTTKQFTYSVHVTDPNAIAVPNAEITLVHSQGYQIGFTDSEGFSLFRLPVDADYQQSQILIEAAGYPSYRRYVGNLPEKTQADEFRLAAASNATATATSPLLCTFAFRVLDKMNEQPLPKVNMFVTIEEKQVTGFTDSTGYYSGKLPCSDLNPNLKVRVQGDGYLSYAETVVLVGETKEILLTPGETPTATPTFTLTPSPIPNPPATTKPTPGVTATPHKPIPEIKVIGAGQVRRINLVSRQEFTATQP